MRILTILAALLTASPALAADRLSPLGWPAIPVRDPAHALLISVTPAGARLVAVGAHGLIIYSDDNGKSWHQAAVPTSETITSVDFADAQNGWAAGDQGVILHSTDGGAHWQMQLDGNQVLALMQTAASALAASSPGSDAGTRAENRATIMGAAGADKPFLTVLAASPQQATIFGAYRIAVRTEDGGKSWVDWSLHVGDPVSHNIYKATEVNGAIYLTGEAGVVLRSDDQGQNYAMQTVPDENSFLGILGTQQGSIITYGVAGEIYRSTDKGKTWTAAKSQSAADLADGLALRSGAILLAGIDGNLFISHDDGKNFTNAGANMKMGVYGLAQAANGDIVFVGSGGVRVEPASFVDKAP